MRQQELPTWSRLPPELPPRARTLIPHKWYRLWLEQCGVEESFEYIAEQFTQSGFAQLQGMKWEGVSILFFIVVNGWMLSRPERLFKGEPLADVFEYAAIR